MPSAERALWLGGVVLVLLSGSPRSEPLALVHERRYAMGTMFDIVAYHASRATAQRVVTEALEEVLRLEAVMSHFRPDSDLTMLNRRAGGESVTVDASLHEVIRASVAVSRRSGGRFDVTIAPLLRVWKRAAANATRPSADEIAEARRCVGYEKIEIEDRNRVRLRARCVEIDLGGIGKGYAVDRAFAILGAAGIRHAMINAGGSSMMAAGAPPDRTGWPVVLGRSVLLLSGNALSTSQQDPAATPGDIVDPIRGAPVESHMTVGVIVPSATVADALSTTLIMLPVEEGRQLVAQFPDASAVWISPAGGVHAAFGESRLNLVRRY